jgi:hypothetical protein
MIAIIVNSRWGPAMLSPTTLDSSRNSIEVSHLNEIIIVFECKGSLLSAKLLLSPSEG